MDKAKLFAKRLHEEEYEIDGVGSVTIRSLSREEAMPLRDRKLPVDEVERKLLSAAMVDPQMSEDDVRQWQAASSAGEIEAITQRIAEISGMTMRADKEAYKSAGE